MERQPMSLRPSRICPRHQGGDGGFSLIELTIAMVLSTLVVGVIVAALITSQRVANTSTAQINASADTALISSFLFRDAQSAGGIDPATGQPNAIGVSTTDTGGCTATSSAPLVIRFGWVESTSPSHTMIALYTFDSTPQVLTPGQLPTTQILIRQECRDGVPGNSVVLSSHLSSVVPSCIPVTSPICTRPTSVSLTVNGSALAAPFLLTASLRSAQSQLTIVGPSSLPAGQQGAAYTPTRITTIGAVQPSTWSQTGLPAGLALDPSTGMISGTPASGVRGSFVVTVTITDASTATASRPYTIQVLAPPEAVADSYAVNEDSTLNVPAPGLLANDSSDGTKTAILYSGVANGSLTFTSDGSFIYSPRANFNGTDSFRYKLTDGSLDSNVVTVTLTVNPVNDAPVNRVPIAQRTARNTNEVFSNSSRISLSDVDAGNATIQVQLIAMNGTVTLPGATGLASSVGSGTATMTITGTIANINLSLANATFTPSTDFIGAAALQIVSSDLGNTGVGGALGDTESVDITVTNNVLGAFTDKSDISGQFKPGDSTYSDPNYTVSSGKGGLGGNADGFQFLYRSMTGDGRLTARVVSFNANGNGAQAGVMFRETLGIDSSHATVDITNSGTAEFLYRPGTGQPTTSVSYPGPAAPFWMRLTRVGNVLTAEASIDGLTWFASSPTTIIMTPTIYVGLAVTAQNNGANLATAVFDQVALTTPPKAFADTYSVNEDTALSVNASSGVLANDSDPEGDSMTAVVVSGAAGLTLNPDGSFAYVPPTNFAGTVSFTYKANDAALSSVPATVTIAVNPANETPSFIKGANQTIEPAAGAQVVAGWATAVSQGSSDTGQLVDFIVTSSAPSFFSVQPGVSASGTLTYGTAGISGTAIVSVSIHDNGGTANGGIDTSAIQTFTIVIDDPPVVTASAAALTYTENATTTLDTGVTPSDIDSPSLSSATVTMTTAYVNGQDMLAFVNQNGITGNWTAATGVLALSGSATVANYQTALRSITYNNTSHDPSTTTRTVTFVVNDGIRSSTPASRTITVTSVNDAPVNGVPGSQTMARNTIKTFSSANGNLISTSDLEAATVQVQLVSTNGTTTLSGFAGLTFTVGDGTADATMTFSGTKANVNARLAGLRFNAANVAGAASLRIVTSDLGSTGTGGTLTDTDTIAITLT
jgi:regulation of enolase protein 1 (concanavalin A-like superfamily)